MVFALTMGLMIFAISFLGASAGPGIALSLRRWGRRVQVAAAALIILVGLALVYEGANPGVFDRLIL